VKPTLSIVILSLASRARQLEGLLQCLNAQKRIGEVELLICTDQGQASISTKRNRMVSASSGRYVCHIDDDDRVAPHYVPAILEAIDGHQSDPSSYGELDTVLVRGVRTIERVSGGHRVVTDRVLFDYRVGGKEAETVGGILYRSPGHICPLRADIAKAHPFPEVAAGVGEDIEWVDIVKPHIQTSVRAGKMIVPPKPKGGVVIEPYPEILYFYRYEPNKTTPALEQEKRHKAKLAGQAVSS
jgi:glycosyltransferase involved in cell wall biosynthesis